MQPDHRARVPAELCGAFTRWMMSQRHLTHHVTLASNWDLSAQHRRSAPDPARRSSQVDRMTRLLYGWDARVNHSLCGRRWQKRPDERLQGFAFIEHIETNIHWHILASLAAGKDAALFETAAHNHWERLVPGGNVKVQPIDGLDGLARYDTKELKHAMCFEHVQMIGTLN